MLPRCMENQYRIYIYAKANPRLNLGSWMPEGSYQFMSVSKVPPNRLWIVVFDVSMYHFTPFRPRCKCFNCIILTILKKKYNPLGRYIHKGKDQHTSCTAHRGEPLSSFFYSIYNVSTALSWPEILNVWQLFDFIYVWIIIWAACIYFQIDKHKNAYYAIFIVFFGLWNSMK